MKTLRWSRITSPGQVAHVARRRLPGGDDVPVHTHDFAEVLWVEAGSGIHEAGGEPTRLRPGDLVLVRPHDRHGLCDGDAAFTIVNVAFPADTLRHLKRRYFSDDPSFFGGRATQPAVSTLDPAERQALSAASEALSRSPADLLGLERFLLNLLHDLAGRSTRAPLSGCPPWLREALSRFRDPEHLGGGVRALAALAGRSPEHVARQLRACAGRRPIDVVTEARVRHAASQLALTDRPILDVALECGFDSLSHFYRVFRRERGETPRAYRRRSHSSIR